MFSFDADGAAPIDPTAVDVGGTPLPAPVDPQILAADAASRQGRELQPTPEVAPDTAADSPALPPSATELVRDAYGRLASEDEAYVRLARIRADLDGTLTADQVTDALMELRRAGDVSLIPEENQKTLGPDDHAAAVSYGNQSRHLIAVDGRRVDQLLAAQSTPPLSVETDSPTVEPTPDPAATTAVPDTTEGMAVDTQTVAERLWNVEPVDFRPGTEILVPSGAKARVAANIDALRVLAAVTAQDRYATADEQAVLARWSSWGATPQVFDPRRDDWAAKREQIRSLLDDSAWAQAQRTILNAHYTDPAIAAAMWKATIRAGFTGGRVLEPGCGSGTFIAHSPGSAQMVGVELDATTAAIAAALNPSAQIRAEGFEKTTAPASSFTAAIGNVPFGDYRLYDPVHNQAKHSIHNHFIVKSLAMTAPGGYVTVLTSRFTLDAQNQRARRDIAALGDLVGAVRLPSNAFRRVAGTEVVTDILVLRRRADGVKPAPLTERFLQLENATAFDDVGEDKGVPINAVYTDHPEWVLGELRVGHGQYGNETLSVDATDSDVDLASLVEDRLTAIVDVAKADGLGLTASWRDTLGPTREDFERGLLAIGNGPAEDELAVGTLRHDAQMETIERWNSRDWEPVNTRGAKQVAEWGELLALRDTTHALIDAQRGPTDLSQRQALREILGEQYDAYVARYGPINRFKMSIPKDLTESQHDAALAKSIETWRKDEGVAGDPYAGDIPEDVYDRLSDDAWINPRQPTKLQSHLGKALRTDPTFAAVLSLEHFDEETMTARKAAIFHTDVLHSRELRSHAETVDEAMAISLDEQARLDVGRIAELLGTTVEHAETQMEGRAFRTLTDPARWVSSSSYLSGNVRTKLADAEEIAALDPRYQANVDALTAVIPPRKTDVDVALGAPWVPIETYTQFVRETFEVPADVPVTIERASGRWTVAVDHYPGAGEQDLKWGLVPKRGSWSTKYNFEHRPAEDRGIGNAGMRAGDYGWPAMLTDLLNSDPIEITSSKEFRDSAGAPTVHDAATRAAQSKARRLAQEFGQWALHADEVRREQLLDIYNDKFNSLVAPVHSGAHMAFPGLGEKYSPYPYQRNAAARIVSEPTVLLDHVVGAGKTGTILMGAMELKRLGLADKPWVVVPNHIIDQVVREAGQWYPGARILSGSAATDAEGRRLLVAQSASQDWDMVIVPRSAFSSIGVDPGTKAEYIRTQVADLDAALVDATSDLTIKRLEAMKTRLEEKLETALEQAGKDRGLTFEASGCDYLFVDEAHEFKNLARASGVTELANEGSHRATDMDLKLNYLRSMRREEAITKGIPPEEYVERVATFATGTPVANSLAELWVMQHYLRPDLLEDAGVAQINDWGATFTDTVERVELNSSGSRLRAVTRVGEFTNVGDLIGMTSVYTDAVTRDQVPANLPVKDGGRNTDVTFTPALEVQDFIADLGYRADHADAKRPDIDNALKIANDGRNATLDPRVAHLDPAPPEHSRAHIVAQRILDVHDDSSQNTYLDSSGEPHPTPGALQIVFCDRSTPKADGSWSIYDGIREELLASGMEHAQIAYVHDYPKPSEKARLFEMCRTGKVSVVFGSTEKMGTGTNIQDRAIALHHVDVPWRPADLEQREGRIIRQGNQNAHVKVFNYVAEKTFDTVMWQTVHRKAHFIEQLKRADRSMRRVVDLDSDSLAENSAMTKALATGDDRYIQQIELDSQLQELQSEADSHFAEQRSIERDRDRLRREVPRTRQRVAQLAEAAPVLKGRREVEQWPGMTIRGVFYDKRSDAANAMAMALQTSYRFLKGEGLTKTVVIAEMSGFPIEASRPAQDSALYLSFSGLGSSTKVIEARDLHPKIGDSDRSQHAFGLLTRVENMAYTVDTDLAKAERSLDRDEQRLDDLELVELSDFPKAVQLKDLSNEVARLRREIKEAETSPEALARDAARAERAAAKGREPKWSLMLNPTPALVEDLGMGSADDVRAMMHDKAIAAQLAAAQSAVADGQLGSGDTSTRPGNFLRAVDDNPGTAKPWNGAGNQAPESGPEHGTERGHDYGAGD
ncbi:helicase-related protein [Rhodococcus sp. ARC_M5]|uniref:helicase-related protein n=1 Tax=Rhodococcus sp. ARC_M5 TaxID=2928851 RepID=UPI001FB527DE|nr:helicase-related protein [Rhodococcus sp. ARC_M5]MCJ0894415.1 helicase [Rhodococcus sp. ARC_M5]